MLVKTENNQLRMDLGSKAHHMEEAQRDMATRQESADKRLADTEHTLCAVATKFPQSIPAAQHKEEDTAALGNACGVTRSRRA